MRCVSLILWFCYSESPSEEIENAREGIYWLVKASEQGHIEATDLLKTCLETGRGYIQRYYELSGLFSCTIITHIFSVFLGITEHNVAEVVECLETTRNEKLSVKAMRDLFTKWISLTIILTISYVTTYWPLHQLQFFRRRRIHHK